MSTYVSRYIEVKNKDGKWEWLRFQYPFKKEFSWSKPDIVIDGKEFTVFRDTCNNACFLREYLVSGRYAFHDNGLGDRGFPTDMSEELKEYFKENYENNGIPDYRYNKSYVSLNELINVYKKEKKELIDRYLKSLKDREYSKFHKKLDRLLKVSSLMMEGLNEEDKEKEIKKTNNLLKKKKNEEDNEDEATYEEDMEYLLESFNEIESIKDEYTYTWRLVDEIYGWIDDNDIRIVFYFS